MGFVALTGIGLSWGLDLPRGEASTEIVRLNTHQQKNRNK